MLSAGAVTQNVMMKGQIKEMRLVARLLQGGNRESLEKKAGMEMTAAVSVVQSGRQPCSYSCS